MTMLDKIATCDLCGSQLLGDVYTFRNGKAIQIRAFADRRQALEWAWSQSVRCKLTHYVGFFDNEDRGNKTCLSTLRALRMWLVMVAGARNRQYRLLSTWWPHESRRPPPLHLGRPPADVRRRP